MRMQRREYMENVGAIRMFGAKSLTEMKVLRDRRDTKDLPPIDQLVRDPRPRNKPCPCGSGLKAKHCCIRKERELNVEQLRRKHELENTPVDTTPIQPLNLEACDDAASNYTDPHNVDALGTPQPLQLSDLAG